MARDRLALMGGTPVRDAFPEPRPRLSPAEAAALAEVLACSPDWSRLGDDWPLPCLDALEARWAEAHQAREAVAVSSGTTGLTLVLRALGVPAGDEVLIPAYGCPAVDVAVLAVGLVPVHVDIDPETYCLSPQAAAAAVNPRTAAMVAVHFAGRPATMAPLSRLASRCGLALIEDACQAPGAALDGRSVGSWGAAAVFSLGVRKPITAGEGGLVTTDDPKLAAALRVARSLGADPESGEIAVPTGNFRLTELQAAVALAQLERMEADRERREWAADRWTEALAGCTALRPLAPPPPGLRHTWAQFWLRRDEEAGGISRERVAKAVRAEGIPLHAGWTRPNTTLQCYTPQQAGGWLRERHAGRDAEFYARAVNPNAERAAFREALLLDFPLLDAEEGVVSDVAAALRKVAGQLEALA